MIMLVFSSSFATKTHVRRIMYKHSIASLAEKDIRIVPQGLTIFFNHGSQDRWCWHDNTIKCAQILTMIIESNENLD